jgi:preprotein translocase subunit SecE
MQKWLAGVRKKSREAIQFVEEAWAEMKRVHWPSRKETSAATLVVLILVLIVSLYLGLIDYLLGLGIRRILG